MLFKTSNWDQEQDQHQHQQQDSRTVAEQLPRRLGTVSLAVAPSYPSVPPVPPLVILFLFCLFLLLGSANFYQL